MPRKYEIPVKDAAPRFRPVGKYATVESREDCAGSCRNCVKKNCVYEVFKEDYRHLLNMGEPEYLYICQSCFRCVQECTRGIFSRVINPEYRTLGDEYWTPEILSRTWYQAHTGKIPVSGAGYRGPFVGEGFDSMWTDMSEIVRPTRDGIHGREYINTCIELTRRPKRIDFSEDALAVLPPVLEIPLPVIFQQPGFGVFSENTLVAMARAAHVLGTFFLVPPESYADEMKPYFGNMAPRLDRRNYRQYMYLVRESRLLELDYEPGIENEFQILRAENPQLAIMVGMSLDGESAGRALELTLGGVDAIHFYASSHGKEVSGNPRFLKDAIRDIHLKLVANGVRQQVNLLFSGGIAMAEHMAKAIICGADGVSLDIPLLVALECRLCRECVAGGCPVGLGDIESAWGSQRIINLMGAWRNQLIEVMGAFGMREARRMRGEVGRSLWFEDMERESFAPIFGERKVAGVR